MFLWSERFNSVTRSRFSLNQSYSCRQMQRGTDMQERDGLWPVNAARKVMPCSVPVLGWRHGYHRHINKGRREYRSPCHSPISPCPYPSSLPYVRWSGETCSCRLPAAGPKGLVSWFRRFLSAPHCLVTQPRLCERCTMTVPRRTGWCVTLHLGKCTSWDVAWFDSHVVLS